MGILTSLSLDEIRARGSIKDGDVLRMRRAFNDDHAISTEEAEALLALDGDCAVKDPSWVDFYVEALTDYVVAQARPEGYVDGAKAQWLIARIGRDGRVDSHSELALLVHVLDKARWSPPSLVRFALDQVRLAVVSGAGPLRSGQALDPGAITEGEVDLVRRILHAFGGDGCIAVTRAEADVLLEINRAVAPGKSSPAWTDLFVKAVGNALLSGFGHAVPSREAALAAEAWLDDADPRGASTLVRDALGGGREGATARSRIGSFVGRMVAGGAGRVWASMRIQSPEERALARLERQRREIITSETIDEAEETWLLDRLGRKEPPLDENEMALLAFLEREASSLPISVRQLSARAVIAA